MTRQWLIELFALAQLTWKALTGKEKERNACLLLFMAAQLGARIVPPSRGVYMEPALVPVDGCTSAEKIEAYENLAPAKKK